MSELYLEMSHVKKSFGDLEVLKDISLTVHQGQVVSIIGPSGSGKSTLLRCATLLETMDSGELSYLGQYAAKNETDAAGARQKRLAARCRDQQQESCLHIPGLAHSADGIEFRVHGEHLTVLHIQIAYARIHTVGSCADHADGVARCDRAGHRFLSRKFLCYIKQGLKHFIHILLRFRFARFLVLSPSCRQKR